MCDIISVACSLRMYNSLVQKCFTDCVESFRRKDLDSAEEKARGPLIFSTTIRDMHHVLKARTLCLQS